MQNVDNDAWDKSNYDEFPVYHTNEKNLTAWSKRAAKKKTALEVLWRGAACTCGAGASHVMCVVVPAMAGGVSGGAGGLLSSAWAMYAISPALAVAVNAGIDRLRRVNRDTWSQIRSVAVSSVVAIGLTGAINYATGHEHFDPVKMAELNALGGVERVEWLSDYRNIHESMDPVLKEEVAQAAAEKGLSPAEYISICSGADPLGARISEASRTYFQQRSAVFGAGEDDLGVAKGFTDALNKQSMLQYNVTEPR